MILADFEILRRRFDTPERQAWHASLSIQTLASAWGLTNEQMVALTGIPFTVVERWSWSEPEGWNDERRAVLYRMQSLHELMFITNTAWDGYLLRPIQLYAGEPRMSVIEAAALDRDRALLAIEAIVKSGLR